MFRKTLALALLTLLMLAGPAWAQNDGLDAQRWEELGRGLSLRPPAGATLVQNTTDGALAKFLFGQSSTISIYIRESPVAMDLPEVQKWANRQFQLAKPSSVMVDTQHAPLEVLDRETARITYLVSEEKAQEWIFSQVFLPLDPVTFVVFQLECDASRFQQIDPLFRRVVTSTAIKPAEELQTQRKAMLDAGEQWLGAIREQGLLAHAQPDRWFRIVRGDRDAGYQHLAARPVTEMGDTGVEVEMKNRLIQGNGQLDTEAQYFVSDDGKNEIWSVRTAQRGAQMAGPDQRAVLNQWSETGVRSPVRLQSDSWGVLQVTQDRPQGPRSYQWGAPPGIYAAQAEVQWLPLILEGRPAELMYYAYHPASATLNLRHEILHETPSGAKVLTVRPTPESGVQTLTFDPQGNLLRWELADGSVLLPATLGQIQAIHR